MRVRVRMGSVNFQLCERERGGGRERGEMDHYCRVGHRPICKAVCTVPTLNCPLVPQYLTYLSVHRCEVRKNPDTSDTVTERTPYCIL